MKEYENMTLKDFLNLKKDDFVYYFYPTITIQEEKIRIGKITGFLHCHCRYVAECTRKIILDPPAYRECWFNGSTCQLYKRKNNFIEKNEFEI